MSIEKKSHVDILTCPERAIIGSDWNNPRCIYEAPIRRLALFQTNLLGGRRLVVSAERKIDFLPGINFMGCKLFVLFMA